MLPSGKEPENPRRADHQCRDDGYGRIDRILKSLRRVDPQNQVPDHAAAHCSGQTQNGNPQNVHLFLQSQHGAGYRKRDGSDNLKGK